MMAGLLFARAGVRTVVLEKHADFLRDFRGDTVHPSTLTLFHELGLLDELLARPHNRVTRISARVGGETVEVVDFTHLPGPAPFIALMPQWEFLDFVAGCAASLPTFELRRECEGVALVTDERGRIAGVEAKDGLRVDAKLVIAADGRRSRMRDRSGLEAEVIGAPMDVFWFRLPKRSAPDNDSMGIFDRGRIFVLIDRGEYWQVAFVFPKGAAESIRDEGLDAFKRRVRAVGPETSGVDGALRSWDDVKLLTVTVDRLKRWHRDGLLVIGDAAHAMSPIGGVGINLAIQDAVAAANAIAGPMAEGRDPDPLLPTIERRRRFAVRATQTFQRVVQDQVIGPLLEEGAPMTGAPLPAKLLDRFALLRRLPGRAVGLGVRPEHVRSPRAHPIRPPR